ncbi:MAG: hypothetical protein AAB830_03270 [Patescibacteria group bacterium]
MWNTLMLTNGILMSLTAVFLVYSIGAAILLGEWKQLLITIAVFIVLMVTELITGSKSEY